MSGDDWLSKGTCGVKLREFEAISQQMNKAAPALDDLAQQMWAILNSAGIDTSPAMKVKSIAKWADSAATDIRRRVRLVHEMDRQKITMAGVCTTQGTYVTMPDRYKDQLAVLEGRAAGDLLKKAANGDRNALTKLSSLANQARNPYFAKAFLETIGAEGLVKLPAGLAHQLHLDMKIDDRHEYLVKDADNVKAVLSMLCQSLAVGTDQASTVHVDDAFLQQLQAAGRAQHPVPNGGSHEVVRGYQSVASILGAFSGSPPFSVRFMQSVGRDMIAYDRELYARWHDTFVPLGDLTQRYHLGSLLIPPQQTPAVQFDGHTDMLRPLLSAAAGNREAAQALLSYTPPGQKNSYLEYLLHERRSVWTYTDRGASLGHAMRVAMSGNDEVSQKLFKEAGQLIGNEIRRHISHDGDKHLVLTNKEELDQLSGLRPYLGDILVSHLDDIKNAIAANKMSGGFLNTGGPSVADIDAMLVDALQDSIAFWTLAKGEIGHAKIWLDSEVAKGRSLSDGSLTNGLTAEGLVLGHILNLHTEIMQARGEDDAAQARADNARLRTLIGRGIGLLPVPYSELFGSAARHGYEEAVRFGYSKTGDWLADNASEKSGEPTAGAKAVTDNEAASALMDQILFSSALQQGQYPAADLEGQPFANNGRITAPATWDAASVSSFLKWAFDHKLPVSETQDTVAGAAALSHDKAISSFPSEGDR